MLSRSGGFQIKPSDTELIFWLDLLCSVCWGSPESHFNKKQTNKLLITEGSYNITYLGTGNHRPLYSLNYVSEVFCIPLQIFAFRLIRRGRPNFDTPWIYNTILLQLPLWRAVNSMGAGRMSAEGAAAPPKTRHYKNHQKEVWCRPAAERERERSEKDGA